MHLSELTGRDMTGGDPVIKGIAADSRDVRPGFLFAALSGDKYDGRVFIADAAARGAAAVLVQAGTDVPDMPEGLMRVEEDNPRRALALMASRFYRRQPEYVAAVTGTNGKTSTVYFAQQLWALAGYKAVSLGTVGLHGAGFDDEGGLTTPDAVRLHETLARLAASGVTHLALEASSHGLAQYRLDGVDIKAAAFTNLSHDHLDYHKTMESYFDAKSRLFSALLAANGTAVLNADVPEYEKLEAMAARRGIRVLSYGEKGRDLCLRARKPVATGQDIVLDAGGDTYRLSVPLAGDFQIMNALCALGLVLAEAPPDKAVRGGLIQGLEKLRGVPGRLQPVTGHPAGAAIYVDYAHTPDALDRVLEALRPHVSGRLFCIIGCGGDRDRGKRPVMAKIAYGKADIAIITDDNPRGEDPAAIRADMLAGAPQAREIADRKTAIQSAVAELQKGDILVIAGKGHETGQIIKGAVEPFNDVTEAQAAVASMAGDNHQTGKVKGM